MGVLGRVFRPELSVVLPCYNEAAGLEELVRGYALAAPGKFPWELILVDNGSGDGTGLLLKRLARKHRFLRPLNLGSNRGYGGGIAAGLKAAKGKILAWSHADLQCAPADVFRACEALRPGVLVKGARQGRFSLLTLGMTLWARLWLWQPLGDINAQPKAFEAGLLKKLGPLPQGFEFDVHVLHKALKAGWKIESLPVRFARRRHGESKWAGLRLRTVFKTAAYIARLRFQR